VAASIQGSIVIINHGYIQEYDDTNSRGYYEITEKIIIAVRKSQFSYNLIVDREPKPKYRAIFSHA
jgi:hypothetical protein